MSDYTPTTEEVRSAWMDGLASLGAEFDRWLAEVKAQAWEEGYLASRRNRQAHEWLSASNPYRQGENK